MTLKASLERDGLAKSREAPQARAVGEDDPVAPELEELYYLSEWPLLVGKSTFFAVNNSGPDM